LSGYCTVAPADPVHRPYHDHEYGFPTTDETVLFERLSLEIFQAGLSWRLVLLKRRALADAFAGFGADAVAAFGATDVQRLLADRTIIRNRRKIEAVIANAGAVCRLREEAGGFAAWLAVGFAEGVADGTAADVGAWARRLRQRFRFIGPEVVREFLLSIGYLEGAHAPDCPVAAVVRASRPPWLAARTAVAADDVM
jgi:DNA-3-methyladenine glycosylase I